MKDRIVRVVSRRPLKEVLDRIAEAAPRWKLSIPATHDLQERIVSKGLPFERPLHVVEVCNAAAAKAVLDANLHIATLLPCRISVYREGHGTVLETLRPSALVRLFDEPALEGVALEMEKAIVAVMEEAAS